MPVVLHVQQGEGDRADNDRRRSGPASRLRDALVEKSAKERFFTHRQPATTKANNSGWEPGSSVDIDHHCRAQAADRANTKSKSVAPSKTARPTSVIDNRSCRRPAKCQIVADRVAANPDKVAQHSPDREPECSVGSRMPADCHWSPMSSTFRLPVDGVPDQDKDNRSDNLNAKQHKDAKQRPADRSPRAPGTADATPSPGPGELGIHGGVHTRHLWVLSWKRIISSSRIHDSLIAAACSLLCFFLIDPTVRRLSAQPTTSLDSPPI